MTQSHEVFLERNRFTPLVMMPIGRGRIIGQSDPGLDSRVGHRNNRVRHVPRLGNFARYLAQTGAFGQARRAIQMSRHVAIAEVEPVIGCRRVLGPNCCISGM